jgi:PhnB protein
MRPAPSCAGRNHIDVPSHADIQPELWVSDGPAAVAFYERAFGAVVEHRVNGPAEHDVIAQLAVAEARFWVSNGSDEMGRFMPDRLNGATARMLLVVDDPEVVFATAVAAGATPEGPVHEEHGWLLGRVKDPFGHQWEIGRPQ